MRARTKRVGVRRRLAPGMLVLGVGLAAAAAWGEPGYAPGELLVRFQAEGPHALADCAQRLSDAGDPFQRATADRSDSLDRLQARWGVREVRALFRRPGAGSFSEQRARRAEQLEALRAGRAPRAGRAVRALPDLSHVYRMRLARVADVPRAVAAYRADPHVVWAQPNYRIEADFVPNDPFFASSGSWGQAFRDLWGLERIHAPSAWDVTQGEGVVVAVVDTGLDYDHPDIAANVWINAGEDLDGDGLVSDEDFNGLDDDGNGFVDDLRGFDFANSEDGDGDGAFDGPRDISDSDPFDDVGHGTHVAGTIAAVGNNAIGVLGVAPRARIMPLKGFKESGPSTIEVLSRAMLYAVENGARVINNSWSCGEPCPSNPLAEDIVRLSHALGVVVVTSAGNQRSDIVFYSPENMRETIAVAAHTEDDSPADFTNHGLLLDVTAPGAGRLFGEGYFPRRAVLSLRSSGAGLAATGSDENFVVGEDYLRWAGTSMSCPHVAGVVALLLAARPDLAPDEVRALLRVGASDVGPPGHDRASGAGIVDAARSLSAPLPGAWGEIASPRQGVIVNPRVGSLLLEGTAGGPDFESYALWVGSGSAPESWSPLEPPSSEPVEAGVLAVWPVEDLEDGAYVVRLDVHTTDGARITEFLQLSLERNVPHPLSSDGAAAFWPAVSGERIAWQSARPSSKREDRAEEEGINLFLTDLALDLEAVLSDAPGDQRDVAIDGTRLAWIDARDERGVEIFECWLKPRQRSCHARAVTDGPLPRRALLVSEESMVWLEWIDRETRWALMRCAVDRWRRCVPELVVRESTNQLEASLDGNRLVWLDLHQGRIRLLTCVLTDGACEATEIVEGSAALLPVVSGNLVAWVDSSGRIAICELDAATGACPPVDVAAFDWDSRLALAEGRLVWDAKGAGDNFDIFFCEYDRVTRSCPVQQLTGSAADQRSPDIDGTRVVWADVRAGPSAIFAFELPSLTPLEDRRVREEQELVVAVRGTDPSGGVLSLSAAQADGAPLEAMGARFVARGDGSGTLWWRPGPSQAGSYAVTITGTSEGRLRTRQSFRIEVRAAGAVAAGARAPLP